MTEVTPNDPRFLFWQRWVLAFSALSALLGLVIMVGTGTALFAGYERTVAKAFWGGTEMPAQALRQQAWLMTLVGSGTTGWGITQVFVAAGPFKRREKWAHDCLWVSIAAWVVLDIAGALYFGVLGELLFAAGAVAAAAPPLAMSRRYFNPRP